MPLDLLRLASEAPTPKAFEATVLRHLQREVGFDVAFFSMKGHEAAPSVVGLEQSLVDRAVRGGARYAAELEPVKTAALRARGVAVDTRVLGERGVRRSAYFREVARAVGGRHSLMAYVPLRGQTLAAIMLGRCGSGSVFSDSDIEQVEQLLPALGVARASYALPAAALPLPVARPAQLLGRWGLGRKRSVLAVERVGSGTVEVRDRDGFREMVARENGRELVWTRASLRDASESGWPYVDLFHLAVLQARARGRALFIGSGGAVALRQFARVYPGLAIDLVEREAQVIALARAWYGLDATPGLTVHIAAGERFVREGAPASFDIAIIDAFDASEMTADLHRAPFFEGVRRLLRPGGAVGVNVIGTLDGLGPVRDVATHLRRSFRRVRVLPVMVSDESYSPSALRNVVLVASKPE